MSFIAAAAILLLAIFLYDVMSAIAKHLSQGYPVQQLSMFRNLFGMVPTLIFLFLSKKWVQAGRPIKIRQWKLGLARGGMGALAQVSFYMALSRMEIATATTIVFAGPLFITALSIPVLGHRVGLWRWVAVLIGFIGVVLVIRPSSESFTWIALLPLCAAFGYASIGVSSQLFDKTVSTPVVNLYANVGSLVVSTTFVIFTGGFVSILTMEDWAWLLGMGLAGGTASFCIITAYRLKDPSSLSPFEYFGIPFSFMLGWIFFAETPFDRLIPGVFLVVGGGLLIIWREQVMKKS